MKNKQKIYSSKQRRKKHLKQIKKDLRKVYKKI